MKFSLGLNILSFGSCIFGPTSCLCYSNTDHGISAFDSFWSVLCSTYLSLAARLASV